MILFKKTVFWMVTIFLLSSIFRLFNLHLIEFKSDEATTVYQTIQFFDRPYLIERGLISGTGIYNFPLFNYLMIPLSLWSYDPMVFSGAIALINSLLIVVFFLMVKKYYDQLTAIFASLLLAFSPWGVIFSRKVWAQDLIFLFLIPFLWLLHEIILRKNTKVTFPMFVLLALLVQLHGSGLFLLAVTILILLILRVKLSLKSAAAGILIGLIPAISYLFFQINSLPPCPDCEAFLKYQNSIRIFDFNNFLRPFQIISGLGYHFVLGRTYNDFINAYPLVNLLKYVFTLGFLAIITGLIFVIVKKRKYLFLVIYFVSLSLFYLITRTQAYMHYFVIVIPISVLLFAILMNAAFSYVQGKFLKTMVIAGFSVFLASNILFLYFFNNFLELKKSIEGDYGPIYSLTKSFIEKEVESYKSLSYYPQLRGYAYIYAQSKNLHSKLGEFFSGKGAYELAKKELQR